MKLKYLIVGTGRSGTVFMARLLTSLGIPCGHESVFNVEGLDKASQIISGVAKPSLSHTSMVSWKNGERITEAEWLSDVSLIEADSSYMAAPFLNSSILKETQILHVVRNPFKVVNSFSNYIDYFDDESPSSVWEFFIYQQLPELKKSMTKYDRAALFYVLWNELIEKRKCDFFHRLEDGAEPVINYLGAKDAQPFSNTEVNTYKKWSNECFGLHFLKSKEIKYRFIEMGNRYGYRMSEITMI
jgi:hypothetical protein